jgi:hypothetical protein
VTVIVCYAKCDPCRFGCCYDPPLAHGWAEPEDIEQAKATGDPEPQGLCACPCAQEET